MNQKIKICFIVILIVAGIYLLGGFAITAVTFHQSYRAHNIEKYSTMAHWEHYSDRYQRREVRFPSGENELIGHVYTSKLGSQDHRKGLIVFSHGIWSGPEEYLTLITWLTDKGWDVFGYTYTSYNGSEGKWAKGLPQSVLDLDAALTYIEQDGELSKMPKVLLGHSWGAYATAAVLSFGHDVKAAASLSGFSDPVEISVSVAENMIGKPGRSLGWIIDLFDKALFRKDSRHTAVEGINSVDIPILLLHGTRDDFIGIDTTSIISHKEEFTNKKVEYIIMDDELQSAHNNYFGNKDATLYYREVMAEYEKIEEQYPKKKVPETVRKEFFESIDLDRANQPNEELFIQIENFLDKAV